MLAALCCRAESPPPGGAVLCKRWILVIYGSDPAETGARKIWPPDTIAAGHLQMPLEWLGYEVEFRSIEKPLPDLPLENRYAGVVVDRTLEVPHEKEAAFAQWLGNLTATRMKILLSGNVLEGSETARRQIMAAFNLQGTGESLDRFHNSRVTKRDEVVMRSETKLVPSRQVFCDITAPPQSQVYLSLEAEDDHGDARHFDAAFRAPWGGAIFDPYIVRQYGPNHLYNMFDPFAFLAAVFGTPDFPVPDPTTRDGLRVFFSHIDGDGFNSLSHVGSHRLNAEVIRDEVLKKYPFPVTVSVIEASIRGLEADVEDSRPDDYVRIARDIFSLPNVQAASHTFSHPFTWIPGDDDSIRLGREPANLVLSSAAKYPKIVPEREVTGSLDYVNKNLLPPGHRAELLLWSGNCRPPPEALAAARRAHTLEMNGGTTILSRRWPGLAGVAPRITMMDDELQVYAPAQNEMYYTDDWKASFLGGFANVIETFELTGAPRRLKPVNIYYHFYSGERGDALAALQKAEDWALNQPLHTVHALEYVQSVHGARDCAIFQVDEHHWTLQTDGTIRAFRLPASSGFPQTGLDTGVTGWNDDLGVRYLHTNGSKKVEVMLLPGPPGAPSLVSCTGETTFTKLDAEGLVLDVADLRPVHVKLRLPPARQWRVEVNGKAIPAPGETAQTIDLTTPPAARISVSRAAPQDRQSVPIKLLPPRLSGQKN